MSWGCQRESELKEDRPRVGRAFWRDGVRYVVMLI